MRMVAFFCPRYTREKEKEWNPFAARSYTFWPRLRPEGHEPSFLPPQAALSSSGFRGPFRMRLARGSGPCHQSQGPTPSQPSAQAMPTLSARDVRGTPGPSFHFQMLSNRLRLLCAWGWIGSPRLFLSTWPCPHQSPEPRVAGTGSLASRSTPPQGGRGMESDFAVLEFRRCFYEAMDWYLAFG